jgi:hypothetical protein
MTRAISASGQATLKFSTGQTVNVEARLCLKKSFFSVSGEGEFVTHGDIALKALLSGEPLALDFRDGPRAFILVREAKTTSHSARCRFLVHQ